MNSLRLIPIVFCAAVALLFPGCSGKTSTEKNQTVNTSADIVKVGTAGIHVTSGSSAELAIPVSIQPGYHVNANPATFDYLIATEMTVDKSEGLTFGKPVYPASEQRKFQFAEKPLAVYEGNIYIKLPLQAASNAAKGTRSLAVRLRVQACDEEKCFPPDTLQAAPVIDLR